MSITPAVAPFTGAWIEISEYLRNRYRLSVAPFTGAWIEITDTALRLRDKRSLPSRERGLKSFLALLDDVGCGVAPFTGAWIEMGVCPVLVSAVTGRSLHGSVD